MEHSFDVNVAKILGIHEAILIKHIYFWVQKNKANGADQVEGHYWTYATRKAFTEIFPYLSERQIKYALDKLESLGYILTANHNASKYDRTLWYTITERGLAILQNCQMEVTKLSNGSDEIVTAIPDINTDVKQVIIPHTPTPKKRKTASSVTVSEEEAHRAFDRAMTRSYKVE